MQPPLFWVCLKIFFFFFYETERKKTEMFITYMRQFIIADSEVVVFGTVAEILENLAFLANASNLVLYLKQHMHMSPSKSANNVTNFMGTAFLLALLGGFLSDAFFTTYRVYLISAVIEFMVSHYTLPSYLFFHVITNITFCFLHKSFCFSHYSLIQHKLILAFALIVFPFPCYVAQRKREIKIFFLSLFLSTQDKYIGENINLVKKDVFFFWVTQSTRVRQKDVTCLQE